MVQRVKRAERLRRQRERLAEWERLERESWAKTDERLAQIEAGLRRLDEMVSEKESEE